MPDEASRLLGLAGLRVTGVVYGEGDLALVGRVAHMLWRKRAGAAGAPTRAAPGPSAPPAGRVSGRFRARLAAGAAGGGAHAEIAREERTTRYQVARALALVTLAPSRPVRETMSRDQTDPAARSSRAF